MSVLILMIVLIAQQPLAQQLAQQPSIEYGNPQELKGVTKIYVYTGSQLAVHQDIVKEIAKKLPQLQVMDKAEDAQITLMFGTDTASYFAGSSTTASGTGTTVSNGGIATTNGQASATSTARYGTVTSGSGTVIKTVGPNRVRLLMDFNDTKRSGTGLVGAGISALHGSPSGNFAKEFINAYVKANK